MIKKNLKLFVLVFLVVVLGAAVPLVQKIQETRRGATGSGLPVIFSPTSGDYKVGDTITTYVDLDQPNDKAVAAFTLKVVYDPDYLVLKTLEANDAKGSNNISIHVYNHTQTSNQIIIVGATNSFATGNLRAVKLEFEAKKEGQTSVSLNGAESEVTVCDNSLPSCTPETDSEITDFAEQPANYTIIGEGLDAPEITVSLSPDQDEKKINESFRVDFSANTGDVKISGLNAIFTFDSDQLEVVEVNIPTGSGTPFGSANPQIYVDHEEYGDQVYMLASSSWADSELKNGDLFLGYFILKGKQVGIANFSLESAIFSGINTDGSELIDQVIKPADLRGVYTIGDVLPDCTPPDYRCLNGIFQECTQGIPNWTDYSSGVSCVIGECTKDDFRCYQGQEQKCDTGSEGSFWRDTGNTCNEEPELPETCSVNGADGVCKSLDEQCPTDYTGYSGDEACDAARGHCCIEEVSDQTPSLTFKVKFDEVDEEIPDQRVRVIVKKGGITVMEITDVIVSSDEEGILTGEVELLGVTPGSGYYIIIKGPKHMAERFCLEDQATYCPAGSTLTLGMDNVFDFSGWSLRPGDITGSEEIQDGKIDSLDWSFLVEALISDDEEVREQANLNYSLQPDGSQVLAGDDIRLFVKTMGTKYDDDY